jgi:integrase
MTTSSSTTLLEENKEEERIYSNFINSLRSPVTKEQYAIALKHYMKFHNLTYYSELVSMPTSQIFESIKSFIISMVERGCSTSNMDSHIYALKNFYDMNDIEDIRWRKLKRFRGEETEPHESRRYEYEEIQTLINISDLRMKASTLLMCSGGLRVGALEPLLVSHLERKGDLYKVNVYKGLKGKGKYFTFCTPECAKAIDMYLEFRERCGEKVGPDSPLFRKDFDSELPDDARKHVYPWGYDAIKKAYDAKLIKAGLRTIDHVNRFNRKEVKMTHGFRFFFKSQLVLAKVDPDLRELLLGHSPLKDLKLIYTKMSEDEMLDEYMKAVDNLTIDPANRLRKKVEKLEVEKTQFDRLAAQIAALEAKIK